MLIASKSKSFAKKVGIDQATAREFVRADEREGLWQKESKEDYEGPIYARW